MLAPAVLVPAVNGRSEGEDANRTVCGREKYAGNITGRRPVGRRPQDLPFTAGTSTAKTVQQPGGDCRRAALFAGNSAAAAELKAL